MNAITLPAAFSASENSPADVSRMNKVIVGPTRVRSMSKAKPDAVRHEGVSEKDRLRGIRSKRVARVRELHGNRRARMWNMAGRQHQANRTYGVAPIGRDRYRSVGVRPYQRQPAHDGRPGLLQKGPVQEEAG